MEQFRRAQATIQKYLAMLTVSQKLLIASLVVVMLMTLFVVQQYASTTDYQEVAPGATPQELRTIVSHLQATGQEYREIEGKVMVPASAQRRVFASLIETGNAPADNRIYFDNLVEKQSWTQNYQQNEQLATIARQNELARSIAAMNGVSKAQVFLDVPKRRGIGVVDRTPTASVVVIGRDGLSQDTVDSIAHLVASSTAGLLVENVRVIDGRTNRQMRASTENEFSIASYAEAAASFERQARDKITDLLSYIPGVIISVNAQVTMEHRQETDRKFHGEGEGSTSLLRSSSTTNMDQTMASRGGEPGTRSNAGADVTAGGSSSDRVSEGAEDVEFDTAMGGVETQRVIPGGRLQKMNAVVNIPRDYFVSIWRSQQDGQDGADPPVPTDADLTAVRDAELARIQAEVARLIDFSEMVDGREVDMDTLMQESVVVSMIPILPDFAGLTGAAAGAGGGLLGVTGPIAVGELAKTVGIGALALASLGFVVMTAFKANRRDVLPSAEELVGIPPALQDGDGIVGEAMEADSALSGVELSEDELKMRKMREQIAELVSEHPDQAAKVVTRWATEQV
ncbi:MAG: flagellar M-ring protein FliF C-terminal domain-containing protein [Phycisphaerales bacterium]